MTPIARRLLLPLLALAAVLALLALRPRPREVLPPSAGLSGGDDPSLQRPAAFDFLRRVQVPPAPERVVRRGPNRDRVERWFDRLYWAPHRVLVRTQNQITTLDEEEQRRFVALTRDLLHHDPNHAPPAVTCLGAFSVPEALDLLDEAVLNTNNRVRSEAARALTLLDDPRAAQMAGKLLHDPVESVRRTALRALMDMENDEAGRVLLTYAQENPDEGMPHVLARLSRENEDPDVIPVLRRHVNRTDVGRQFAREGLARWGDPETLDLLYAKLGEPNTREVIRALRALIEAPPEMVEIERVEATTTHPRPEARAVAAQLLGRLLRSAEGERRQRLLELLVRQASDRDMSVRHIAMRALYKAGRHDLAEPFLRLLPTATGAQLLSAVDVLTRVMEEERAEAPMLRRVVREEVPNDVATLLRGLANLGRPDALSAFVDRIRRAGPDEPVDGNRQPLSRVAALYIESFPQEDAVPLLLDLLDDPSASEFARLRALDALRAFPHADIAVELIETACDPRQPRTVREAALQTLPFLDDGDLFDLLSDALQDLEDRDVAKTARAVLLAFG